MYSVLYLCLKPKYMTLNSSSQLQSVVSCNANILEAWRMKGNYEWSRFGKHLNQEQSEHFLFCPFIHSNNNADHLFNLQLLSYQKKYWRPILKCSIKNQQRKLTWKGKGLLHLILSAGSPSLEEFWVGNTQAGAEVKTEKKSLMGLLSACFVIQSSPACLGMWPPIRSWALSHQLSIRTMKMEVLKNNHWVLKPYGCLLHEAILKSVQLGIVWTAEPGVPNSLVSVGQWREMWRILMKNPFLSTSGNNEENKFKHWKTEAISFKDKQDA